MSTRYIFVLTPNINKIVETYEEQKKMASILSTETLQQKLNHLKQEKKVLMQQLLTGKRRVVL